MNPISLYLVMAQTPAPQHSTHDGHVVRRRRRPRRPTASRSII